MRKDSSMSDGTAQTRRREIAAEHLLFKLTEYVEQRQPGLLDFTEASLDHLGNPSTHETKDDKTVRAIARGMIDGARHEVGRSA